MSPLARWCVRRIERYQRSGGGLARFAVDCNFEPSCSEYARQAIATHGALTGMGMGLLRICRCRDRNGVAKTHDPVPTRR
jgi:putative component of membrane protein insertase Oxa1/YidC/SpoIIIJ protein YidD